MRVAPVTLALVLLFAGSTFGTPDASRDNAIARSRACKKTSVSSNQCKHLDQDLGLLMTAYQNGDKDVLPTLFLFPQLTGFFDSALLGDSTGFLTAMARLDPNDRQTLANSIAGLHQVPIAKPVFQSLRVLLQSVPQSSPIREVAQQCLQALESVNVAYFIDYFPPNAFTGRYQVFHYAGTMYALGEQPLWPAGHETIFRFTHLGALSASRVAVLFVASDGTARIHIRTAPNERPQVQIDQDALVTSTQLAGFFARLHTARFWEMPADSSTPSRGLDGAEWMLEGVQDGKYHVVVRWCPNGARNSAQDLAFAAAARSLFELAGYNLGGSC